jgi:hypothetical protein
MLTETDVCFLREANQRKTEKECRNNEEQSGTIRVFYPQESSCKHDGKKKSGTNTAARAEWMPLIK